MNIKFNENPIKSFPELAITDILCNIDYINVTIQLTRKLITHILCNIGYITLIEDIPYDISPTLSELR